MSSITFISIQIHMYRKTWLSFRQACTSFWLLICNLVCFFSCFGMWISKERIQLSKVWWGFRSRSHVDVSKKSGTPKSSILIGFSFINHPFRGTPIFGNTHVEHPNTISKRHRLTIHVRPCFQRTSPFKGRKKSLNKKSEQRCTCLGSIWIAPLWVCCVLFQVLPFIFGIHVSLGNPCLAKFTEKDKLIYTVYLGTFPQGFNKILTCLGFFTSFKPLSLRGILAVLATLGSPDFP